MIHKNPCQKKRYQVTKKIIEEGCHLYCHLLNEKALIISALVFIKVPGTGVEPVQILLSTGF